MSLPLIAAPVTLTLPDREMLPGRVDARWEGCVDVALLAAPRTPPATLQGHQVFLEWVTADGVQRRLGRVAFLDQLPVGASFGVFDVVEFVPCADAQLLQRREYVRTEIVVGVRLRAPQPTAVVVAACTANVGGGGLLVRGPFAAAVGDELLFELKPLDDGGRLIAGRCRVVRHTEDGGAALQFTRIAEADRDEIVRFAYTRELAERERRLAA